MFRMGDIVYEVRKDTGSVVVGIVIHSGYGKYKRPIIRCLDRRVPATHTHHLISPEYFDLLSPEEYTEWQSTINHYHRVQ